VGDLFVQALRNGEVVFNHAVLDQFAWPDGRGVVRTMAIAGSRRHPEHALRIPADTPWWCLCSRGREVGFGMVNAEVGWLSLDGGPPALEPPFIYVANGPWVYVSRALVYPFGSNNPTRLAAVRREAVYTERMLFHPYRLPAGDPFAPLAAEAARARSALALRVAAPTDPRTPTSWVAPILVAPFDEGVKGAVGGRGAREGER
jgi:hypothetical protein